MKYLVKIAALMLTLGLTFTACQKDYDSRPDVTKDPAPNPLRGTFTCTINGGDFVAETKSTTLHEGMLTITGTRYAASREEGTYEQITLVIPNYAGASRYNVNHNAAIGMLKADANGWTATYSSESNDNYFVQIEGSYKGTFQAVLYNNDDPSDRIQIENGKFEIE